jgi:hypothetical protein
MGIDKDIFLEGGCWNAGSSAKLSVLPNLSFRKLYIYVSCGGVEPIG